MKHLIADNSGPGQALFDGTHAPAAALDWSGLTDVRFIANSVGILVLATVLGALIGYHPATRRTIGGLHEADMPHVYVMYAVIGAVIGVAVREFGTVVGVVVFGIGGLIRFRSATDSTRDTVRLIIVTLVGLTAGLGLLHFAVIITAVHLRADLGLRHQTAPPHPGGRHGEGSHRQLRRGLSQHSERPWLQHHCRASFAGESAS